MSSNLDCKCSFKNDLPPNLFWSESQQSESTFDFESSESECSSTFPPELIPYHQLINDGFTMDITDSDSFVSAQSSPGKEFTEFVFPEDGQVKGFSLPLAESGVKHGETIHSFAPVTNLQNDIATQPCRKNSPKKAISSSHAAGYFPFSGASNLNPKENRTRSSTKRRLETTLKPIAERIARRRMSSDHFDDSGFSEEIEKSSRRSSAVFIAPTIKTQPRVIAVITISDSEDDDETAQELVHHDTQFTKVASVTVPSGVSAISVENLQKVSDISSSLVSAHVNKMDTCLTNTVAKEATRNELVPYLPPKENETVVDQMPDVIDAAIFIKPEEPYCEDYDVPGIRRLDQLPIDCNKRFCHLGCICESLSYARPVPDHCQFSSECMWNCHCENLGYKAKLRRRFNSSYENEESQELIRKSPYKRSSKKTIAVPPILSVKEVKKSQLAIELKPDSFETKDKLQLDPANSQLVLYKPLGGDRPTMPSVPNAIVQLAPVSPAVVKLAPVPPAFVEEFSSLKSEVSTIRDTIRDLGSQLQNKQQEVDMLKNQIQLNAVTTGMLEAFPKMMESAKQQFDRLTALTATIAAKEEAKVPIPDLSATAEPSTSTKSESILQVKTDEPGVGKQEVAAVPSPAVKKNNTVPGLVIKKNEDASIPTFSVKKDESAVDGNRPSVRGVYVDCEPLDEVMLDKIASSNESCAGFIRQFMRTVFTFEYLTSKTFSSMDKEHLIALKAATTKRYKEYSNRKGERYPVTDEFIKQTIQNEFSARKVEKRKKGL